MKKNILAASVAAALAFALPALAQGPIVGGADVKAGADVNAGANVGSTDVKAGVNMGADAKVQSREHPRASTAPAPTQKRVLPRQAKSKAGAEGEAKTQN